MMDLQSVIEKMPKVEIHVHLEGATRPETILMLAQKNSIDLPVTTVAEAREWYQFRDFNHFIEIYVAISKCFKTPEDIEFIAREFLKGQAEQNIVYSEVTYSASTHYENYGLSFADQFVALQRANDWAKSELGVSMGIVVDIVRDTLPELGMDTTDRFLKHRTPLTVAFGLGGTEVGHPPNKHAEAFQRILNEGDIPIVPHAGETDGADSIWDAIKVCNAVRIGHGVRCIEDETLVDYLREHQIPLEVNPTSNVCLGVVDSIADHPIQQLIDAGLYVTVNSDDPPMFNTTLTNEFAVCAEAFDWDIDMLQMLTINALNATFLSDEQKIAMRQDFEQQFESLRTQAS
jgi:adenosine deaminase